MKNFRDHAPTKNPRNSLSYKGLFGRRDWTRTNDPHHVKASGTRLQAIVHAGFASTMHPQLSTAGFA